VGLLSRATDSVVCLYLPALIMLPRHRVAAGAD